MRSRVSNLVFLTNGVGRHKEKLTSFELALRDAGIAHLNLVQVSSIFPPYCRLISRVKGVELLEPGEITFVVLSKNSSDEPNRHIGSAIGMALPKDKSKYGYISEHHDFGKNKELIGDYTEDLAATMLASTLGLEIDLDKAWNDRKQEYKIGGQIVRTTNVTQTAEGREGVWTTVVSAAVFCGFEKG